MARRRASVVARHFGLTVEPGAELAKGPYVAESFPVDVEADYLVIDPVGASGRGEAPRNWYRAGAHSGARWQRPDLAPSAQ
jgi:hypothetical protein